MSNKVAEVNLEYGMPTVDTALIKMKNSLITYKMQGYKAVILIHGYGASGVGGSIKTAVIRCLRENSMRGIVRVYVGGDQWFNRKREILDICKDLKNFERKIASNNGVTVVLLK
ncbi:MAG TPA: hypothetical protein VIK72_08480 [Clostridiaceae bacterium]